MHITAERIDYKQIWRETKKKKRRKEKEIEIIPYGQFLSLIGTGTPTGSVHSLNVKNRHDGNTK